MTDKEEVIVDKINLKECKYFKGVGCINSPFKFWGCTKLGGMCSEHPGCYFKQLKRKEQECEELKEYLNQAKYLTEGALRSYSERQNIKYKQALYEIEINISEYQALTFDKPRTMRENDCIYNILDIIDEVKRL